MKKILQNLLIILLLGPASATSSSNDNPFVDMMRSMLDIFEMMQLYQNFSGHIGTAGLPQRYGKQAPYHLPAPSNPVPGHPPADTHLDGAWASQNRILLAIKQQYARMYWSRDQYRDFYIEIFPEHLRLKDAATGQSQDFEYRLQDNQLALRDAKGRVIQFLRIDSTNQTTEPSSSYEPNFWDPNYN